MAAKRLMLKKAPLCACGCGKRVPWRSDRGFGKYASRNCYYKNRPKVLSRSPIRRAARDRMRKYGLTLEEALSVDSQTCEICGGNHLMSVDHDHETEMRRGWLCRSCNSGIALLGEDTQRLRAAIEYLERYRAS
jgi:hypothetical protein